MGAGAFSPVFRGGRPRGADPSTLHRAGDFRRSVRRRRGRGCRLRLASPSTRQPPRLRHAADRDGGGIAAPGPLGIQIHPDFGPWWAYRALVVVPLRIDGRAAGWPRRAPAARRPARRLARATRSGRGAHLLGCTSHRWQTRAAITPASRAGPASSRPSRRTRAAQLGFHMAASLATVRRSSAASPGSQAVHPPHQHHQRDPQPDRERHQDATGNTGRVPPRTSGPSGRMR